jgi:hypothetical protein
VQLDFKKVLPSDPSIFGGFRTVRIVAALFILLSLIRSCIHLFAPDGGADSIAGVDISVEGGNNIVAMFHLWGAMQLIVALLLLVLFIRYPGLTPLILLTLAIDPVMRAISGHIKHVTTVGTAPGEALNTPAFVVLLLLFIASLINKKTKV